MAGGRRYDLRRNVKVLAFGKAVLGMVAAVHRLLHDHIATGHASIPVGLLSLYQETRGGGGPTASEDLSPSCLTESPITLHEGARNNLPDEAAMRAAETILSVAKAATEVLKEKSRGMEGRESVCLCVD